MAILLALVMIAVGVALLGKGADWMVDGSSSVARRWGVAPIVVGLTIVAFGTSAPELVVNLMASLGGRPEIAIGNIIGSNIANILLILGIAAAIRELTIKPNTVWKEIPYALLAVLLVGIMASDAFLAGRTPDVIDRIDAFALLGFFAVFLYYTFGIAKAEGDAGEAIATMSMGRSALLIFGGLAALVIGGKATVDGALEIVRALGVSERIIGLTVVAVGTSLPELVTSAVAARKGHVDIAVGNVVGSNIFNVFFVLGISGLIRPLPFTASNLLDVGVAIGAALALFLVMFVGKRHRMERWQGWLFIAAYAAYVIALICGLGA